MNNQLSIVQDIATGKEQTNVEVDLNGGVHGLANLNRTTSKNVR